MTDPVASLTSAAALLRDATSNEHQAAERSAFQRQLVGGKLPRDLYARFLGQMRHIWSAIDDASAGLRAVSRFHALAEPSRSRTRDIDADLLHLAADGVAPPLPAAAAFASEIRHWGSAEPHSLVGAMYVVEGSTNGGRFIARSVRRAYGFEGVLGTRFLDPYGEQQARRWAEWKGALDDAVTVEEAPRLIAAAKRTFRAIEMIGAEVLPAGA